MGRNPVRFGWVREVCDNAALISMKVTRICTHLKGRYTFVIRSFQITQAIFLDKKDKKVLIIFWWYLLTAKLTGSRMKLVEIKSLISVYPFSIPGKFHLGTPQFFCQQVPSFIVWRSRSMYSIVVHIGKNSVCISHCTNLTYRHLILPCRQWKCDKKWCV